ncbi:hypothetical protein GOODEAATRI_027632 [Goodea atripinnis]|uniref:Uncharacterized protein n=1 Tax=Goodea atripinnis TaxID=208336 RepID=A0ABV0NP22_9TELE
MIGWFCEHGQRFPHQEISYAIFLVSNLTDLDSPCISRTKTISFYLYNLFTSQKYTFALSSGDACLLLSNELNDLFSMHAATGFLCLQEDLKLLWMENECRHADRPHD